MTPDSIKAKTINNYGLYGENSTEDPEFIHIEELSTRSRLYDWNISAHAHPRMFQLVYVVQGQATVSLDQRNCDIGNQSMVCIPGGVVHAFTFSPNTKGWVLTVSELLLVDARYQRSQKLLEPLVSAPLILDMSTDQANATLVETMLEQMMVEFRWPQLGRSFMCDWFSRLVLMTASRHLKRAEPKPKKASKKQDQFQKFRQLIEEHFREHWSAKQYAECLAVSTPSLNRLCHTFSGKSAMELVQERLALEAQRHLIYTSASIDMIAFELGFQDSAYFSRFFKRRAGLAPGQFRKTKLAEPYPH